MKVYYDFDTRKFTVRFTMAEIQVAGRGTPMEYDLTINAEEFENRLPAPKRQAKGLEEQERAIQGAIDDLWYKLAKLKREL